MRRSKGATGILAFLAPLLFLVFFALATLTAVSPIKAAELADVSEQRGMKLAPQYVSAFINCRKPYLKAFGRKRPKT